MPRIDKKYIKDPGALVHKIDIQRKTVSKPVKGIVKEVWETIYSPRCSVYKETGKEYYKDVTEQYGVESKKFTFRTHPIIAIKQKDIIIYQGERWEVISIYDYDDLRMYTVCVAKRAEQ